MLYLALALAFAQQPAQTNQLQQGLLLLRDGKLPEARSSFEALVKSEPKNAFGWVSLAETCRRLADTICASNAATKAEEFGIKIPAVDHGLASYYVQTKQFAHAAKLEEQYAQSPSADPEALLRTAELYQRAGEVPDAERVLKMAWERKPNDAATAFAYAQLLLRKLDFADAEKVVKSASDARPDDPQLVLALGVALYGERRFDDAIDAFLRVIAIDSSIPQPYDFISKMLEHAGAKLPRITQAFEAHQKAEPENAAANLDLAKVKLESDPKQPEAEALLRRAISVDPNAWEAHYELGVLLESKHEFAAAADELKQSIVLNSKEGMPHYHLARVYDRLGQPDQAAAERKLHEQLTNAQK